jgi:hypothetical protein
MFKDLPELTRYLKLSVLIGIGLIAPRCNQQAGVAPATAALISGKVLDKQTLTPVSGALVRAQQFTESTQTNSKGEFSLTIELPDSNSRTVTLIISKAGYAEQTIPFLIIKNSKTTTVPDVELPKTGSSGPQPSGDASNVVLVAIETDNISVSGSGGNETSDLTFEVRDKNGTPVDLQHQVKLNFKITGGPAGGESIFPASALTDATGKAVTTVNSGTKAGTLQIVATIDGKTIASAPVPIAIHGGLPDKTHFVVAPNKLNFPGYNILGLENPITAYVGDKYSNPVQPGTSVWFQTTGGIIEGSAVTDDLGRATGKLMSAAPQPQGIPGYSFPFTEPGFALITAQTVDENQLKITTPTVVLFSGRTQVSVTPTSFDIPPLGAQSFKYTVSDQNSNPLASGTSITVSSDAGQVSGATNITLPDTQSRFYTSFGFALANNRPDSIRTQVTTVTLSVTSPNGNVTTFFTGVLRPNN